MIEENLEPNAIFFKKYHESFYCILCDKNAHGHFNLIEEKVTVDMQFCLNSLRDNKNFFRTINVDLVKYFIIV